MQQVQVKLKHLQDGQQQIQQPEQQCMEQVVMPYQQHGAMEQQR